MIVSKASLADHILNRKIKDFAQMTVATLIDFIFVKQCA
jgi:hypothetical protein